MNFSEIAESRFSCRSYDENKKIEPEKLNQIIKSALLAPSACNAQPYRITVCGGQMAKRIAKATMGPGINTFVSQAPILLVLSEHDYNKSASIGAKIKKNDYRSIDIGILAAYITSEAEAQGISNCILGWFDDQKIRTICGLSHPVRLVISLGYPGDQLSKPTKKRKEEEELVSYLLDD
jgi:nitroreductase